MALSEVFLYISGMSNQESQIRCRCA